VGDGWTQWEAGCVQHSVDDYEVVLGAEEARGGVEGEGVEAMGGCTGGVFSLVEEGEGEG